MIAINIVTDCCYAWNIMETFVPLLQSLIKADPSTVIQLKALFLKVCETLKSHYINEKISEHLPNIFYFRWPRFLKCLY